MLDNKYRIKTVEVKLNYVLLNKEAGTHVEQFDFDPVRFLLLTILICGHEIQKISSMTCE